MTGSGHMSLPPPGQTVLCAHFEKRNLTESNVLSAEDERRCVAADVMLVLALGQSTERELSGSPEW